MNKQIAYICKVCEENSSAIEGQSKNCSIYSKLSSIVCAKCSKPLNTDYDVTDQESSSNTCRNSYHRPINSAFENVELSKGSGIKNQHENEVPKHSNKRPPSTSEHKPPTAEKKKCSDLSRFGCEKSKKNFKSNYHLERCVMKHIDSRTQESKICGSNSEEIGNIKTHMKIHNDNEKSSSNLSRNSLERSIFRPWENVDFARGSRVESDHENVMIKKSNKRSDKCNDCPSIFKQKENHNAKKNKNNELNPFGCEDTTKHTDSKSYEYNICGSTFKEKKSVKKHTKKHDDKNIFICKLCKMSFLFKSILKEHMAKHSDERPHKCTICPSTFNTKSSLTRHLKKHSDNNLFICKLCKKSCESKWHLSIHMAKHSDERPHKCTICPLTFKLKSHLTRHMKIHSYKDNLQGNYK